MSFPEATGSPRSPHTTVDREPDQSSVVHDSRNPNSKSRTSTELSWQVTRCSCRKVTAHPGDLQGTINTKSYQVAHAAPGGHGPPSDGNAQGGPRRPDTEQSRQVTRCSCRTRKHKEVVAAHPATVKCKAGGPRRPDAELILNLIRFDNTSFGRSVCFKMLPAIANE